MPEHNPKPPPDRPTSVLICGMLTPFTPTNVIRAFLKELDELETELAPNSDATESIAGARARALKYLELALRRADPPK